MRHAILPKETSDIVRHTIMLSKFLGFSLTSHLLLLSSAENRYDVITLVVTAKTPREIDIAVPRLSTDIPDPINCSGSSI